ncbi:hypothetical protein SBOR_6412 [Sclerotinia borealis F-4128]|uniref:Uncharacterized protein n=1 Tax=Sclerotinia borealis (strain F-4128) TaxID=1432307 RepID=W9CBJ0_SCLBF|nr:hypothetical protein SBOR_6412 [Sclerotinia borealis F-4128]
MSLFVIPPIATRSATGGTALNYPICLRCSKLIAIYEVDAEIKGQVVDQTCAYPNGINVSCSECTRKHKGKCIPPPVEFNEEINGLLRLRARWEKRHGKGQDVTAVEAQLNEAQGRYTKGVEAYIRQLEKHGLSHKPANTTEAMMVLTGLISVQNRLLEQFLDSYRFSLHLPPLNRPVVDRRDDDDDDDDSDDDDDDDDNETGKKGKETVRNRGGFTVSGSAGESSGSKAVAGGKSRGGRGGKQKVATKRPTLGKPVVSYACEGEISPGLDPYKDDDEMTSESDSSDGVPPTKRQRTRAFSTMARGSKRLP